MAPDKVLAHAQDYNTQATLNGKELQLEGWYIVINETNDKQSVRDEADIIGWTVDDVMIDGQSVTLVHAGVDGGQIQSVADDQASAEEIKDEILATD